LSTITLSIISYIKICFFNSNSSNKNPIEVAIKLYLGANEVDRLYQQFWRLEELQLNLVYTYTSFLFRFRWIYVLDTFQNKFDALKASLGRTHQAKGIHNVAMDAVINQSITVLSITSILLMLVIKGEIENMVTLTISFRFHNN
jgi:hypothetical protein